MVDFNATSYILAIVLPTSTVLLIAVIVFIMSCYKFSMVRRLQRAYWRYTNAKKARNGVFTVGTTEDEGDQVSNVIYKPGGTKAKPPPSPTLTPSSTKDDICLLDGHVVVGKEEQDHPEEPAEEEEDINGDYIDFLSLVSDGEDLQTSYYIPMGRPTRSIRKCHTFCGAPSKPYLIDESLETLATLLPDEDAPRPHLNDRSKSIYITARPIPVARCSPFRRKDDTVDDSILKDHVDKAITLRSILTPKKRNSIAEVMASPIIHRPRKVYTGDFDLNDSLAESCEDLFKEAWWRSSLSLNSNSLVQDDLTRPPLHTRNSTSRQSSHTSNIYVQMDVEASPRACRRPPVEFKRGRSTTMPNIFGEPPRESYSRDKRAPCVSVWYPSHMSGDVQFTAELSPAPKPCSVPHYVNFRGTLPMKL